MSPHPHRVEIKDSNGASMTAQVTLGPGGKGRWRSLVCGAFCYDEGVATAVRSEATGRSWLCLFGGDVPVDKNLVLHLDDYLEPTGEPNEKGAGKAYPQDDLTMRQGALTWELDD